MKTNCCVYRKVPFFDCGERRCRVGAQNADENSTDVKIYYTDTSLAWAIIFFRPPDLLLMYIEIKEEKHDFFFAAALCL